MSQRRVVAITGASAGVGRAAARAFAADGWNVGLLARGEDGLAGARRDVEQHGRLAVDVPTDVADPDAVEEAAARIEDELGPIDVWVNNAMVTVMSEIVDMKPDEFRRVTEVNYLGTVHGTLAALSRMVPRDHGTIVQVGSALAYRAIPLQSAYCATKFAVRGFTDSLRSELLHRGSKVHLTMVQMPALNTPQFGWSRCHFDRHPQPVPPIYQPEVAADAIVFAAKSDRRELWVGGQAAVMMFLNKWAPGVGDRYLAENGYDAQFLDRPIDPDRRDNLYEPVPGDHGAHGIFDEQSKGDSAELWVAEHPAWTAAAAGGILALLGGALGVWAAEAQGRVTSAVGPDTRRRDVGDAEASSRSGNEVDGPTPS